jgi:hypothetical protein
MPDIRLRYHDIRGYHSIANLIQKSSLKFLDYPAVESLVAPEATKQGEFPRPLWDHSFFFSATKISE